MKEYFLRNLLEGLFSKTFCYYFISKFHNVFDLPDDFEPVLVKIADMEKRFCELEKRNDIFAQKMKHIEKGIDNLIDIRERYNKLLEIDIIRNYYAPKLDKKEHGLKYKYN
jgi:hypothetical protein